MDGGIFSSAAIGECQAEITALDRVPQGGMDTALAGHPLQDEMGDAPCLQSFVQISLIKTAEARFIDDRLARQRRKTSQKIMPLAAAHQEWPVRPGPANVAKMPFVGIYIMTISGVALAGVDEGQTSPACGCQHRRHARDNRPECSAIRPEKIPLHINDQKGSLGNSEAKLAVSQTSDNRHAPIIPHRPPVGWWTRRVVDPSGGGPVG